MPSVHPLIAPLVRPLARARRGVSSASMKFTDSHLLPAGLERSLRFYVTNPSPCPYVPDRKERKAFTNLAIPEADAVHNVLSQSGFRRSQSIAYRPACLRCNACRSVRVPVRDFELSRNDRKVMAKNESLVRRPVVSQATREQFRLLKSYVKTRHDTGGIALIWRGGCIIRAQFLHRIADAYGKNENLLSLLFDDYFAKAIDSSLASWRNVVANSSLAGIPNPAFASSLSYYDGLRSKRLPAALVQGQRDFFGAHTYKRVDREGVFHTLWSGDRSEIETTPSSH